MGDPKEHLQGLLSGHRLCLPRGILGLQPACPGHHTGGEVGHKTARLQSHNARAHGLVMPLRNHALMRDKKSAQMALTMHFKIA